MSIFLDVLTVVVFIVIIYRAYKKGIIRALIDLVGFAASFVVAFLLSEPIGKWIAGNFLNKLVSGTIKKNTTSSSAANGKFIAKLVGGIPDSIDKSLTAINVNLGSLGAKAMKSVVDAVSVPLASLISRGIAFFVILAICLVIVKILAHFSDIVRHLPVLGTLNALAGAAIGIVEAVIIMFVLCTLITLSISLMALQKNPPITKSTTDSTHIYKYIQNINPLTGMLLKK